jgi:hypothetical protein
MRLTMSFAQEKKGPCRLLAREKGAPRTPRAREASWATAHQVFLLLFSFFLFSATFLKDSLI